MIQACLLPIVFVLSGAPAAAATQVAVDAQAVSATRPLDRVELAARVKALAAQMQTALDRLQDYTMIMEMAERSHGRWPRTEPLLIKWARPQKLYVKYLRKRWSGREVLFVGGKNGNRVKVRNGVFPDVTINLDPHGSIAMDGNHHPVTEVNLHFFVRTTVRNLLLALERDEGEIELVENQTMLGRRCTLLRWTMAKGGRYHVMRDGETLWDVARRYDSDMSLILHNNRQQGWDEADDPDEGDRVFIPRYYASKAAIWIDDELKLPVKGQFWDFDGKLYEEYRHRDLRVNVGLSQRDFDPDNPAYNF